MNPTFYVFGLVKILKKFEKNIKAMNWHAANRQFINDLGIYISPALKNFPQKGGVLVFANHPTGLDPYILSATIARDDVYILSDVYQTKKGENIASHLIPVYYSGWSESLNRSGISFFGYLMMRVITGTVKKNTARQNNLAAIDTAAGHIAKGHVVIIFPSGGERSNRTWRKGIGEVIKIIHDQKLTCILYRCTINNLSENKLLLHFILKRKYFTRNPIAVTGRVVDDKFITSELSSKEITLLLQNLYNK